MFRRSFMKVIASVLVAAIVPTAFLFNPIVRADEGADAAAIINATIASGAHRCNVDAPRAGNVFLQLMGTFDSTSKDSILSQINSIRLEACQNGLPDPRNRGRALTMADYVPIKWSSGLEEMAMLRAAEASYTLHHVKITGEDCWNSSYNVASFGEVLAWGGGINAGISMWNAERSSWISGNGNYGHFAQIINPSNTYCAFAGFNNTAVGEFTSQGGLDESKINVAQYNSQLAEIGSSFVSGVTLSSTTGSFYIGQTGRAIASGTISAAGYSKRHTYTNIRILPSQFWCNDGNLLTIDGAGNATGKAPGMVGVCCRIAGVTYESSVRVTDASGISGFATRLYSVALNRAPDQTGLDYWTQRLSSRQTTGAQAAYGFFFSAEFQNANLSNEEFILRLYRTFLNRDPDNGGYAYWLQRIADGASRQDVFYGFTGSAEFAGICASAGITPN
jgi:Cysteine-rich secretory protein family.